MFMWALVSHTLQGAFKQKAYGTVYQCNDTFIESTNYLP